MFDDSASSNIPFASPGKDNNLESLLEEAKAAAIRNRKWLPVVKGGLCCWIGGGLALFPMMSLFHYWGLGFGVLVLVAQFATCILMRLICTDEDELMYGVLAKKHDARTLGPLLDALEFILILPTPVQEQVKATLYALLRGLQATDAPLLDVRQRQILHNLLNGKDISLSLAVLRALEQIGDANALPFVEKLAAGQGRAKQNAVLQDAAQNCLPFLQQKARASRVSDQLLRAASSASAPDVLLRPAMGTGDTEMTQLLRPDLNPNQW